MGRSTVFGNRGPTSVEVSLKLLNLTSVLTMEQLALWVLNKPSEATEWLNKVWPSAMQAIATIEGTLWSISKQQMTSKVFCHPWKVCIAIKTIPYECPCRSPSELPWKIMYFIMVYWTHHSFLATYTAQTKQTILLLSKLHESNQCYVKMCILPLPKRREGGTLREEQWKDPRYGISPSSLKSTFF